MSGAAASLEMAGPGAAAPEGAAAAASARLAIEVARGGARDAEVAAFVDAHPHATPYHLPAFRRVVERGGGLATATFLARAPGGPLVGVLPVALTRSRLLGTYATSLPYFNYGGILATDAAAARPLVRAAWQWAAARGARHLVLRHRRERPLDLAETHGKETLTLALPAKGGADALFAAIGSKTRNLVRKARKAGLEARTEGPEGAGAFHAVFAENMRDLGTPPLPARFFRVLLAEAGPLARVHVVRLGARVAAAAITIAFRERVEVPWASTLRRYNDLAANMLLYWHLLEHALGAGARVFDFGRSSPGSGPYKFKLQWGAKPEPLPWYWVARAGRAPTGDLSPTNPKFALAIRVWQRLPVPVSRVIGEHLAPLLP